MIRGWRLDPRWVEYYARRDAERVRSIPQRPLKELIESMRQDVKTLQERELDRLKKAAINKSTIESDYAWQLRNEGKEYLAAVQVHGVPNVA